ncbi:MAG: hypothetical protein NZ870_01585, partial [bacterium]|nr:hypothetical protein [bacterium]
MYAELRSITGIPIISTYVFIGSATRFLLPSGGFFVSTPFSITTENRYYAYFRACTGNSPDPASISYSGVTYDVGFSTSDGVLIDAVGVVRDSYDLVANTEVLEALNQPFFWFMTSSVGSDVKAPHEMKYIRYRVVNNYNTMELRREVVSIDYTNPYFPVYNILDTGYNFVAENISSFTITRINIDKYFWDAPVE